MELNDLDFKLAVKIYDKLYDKYTEDSSNYENAPYFTYCIGRLTVEKGEKIPNFIFGSTGMNTHRILDLYIRSLSEEELNTNVKSHWFNVGKYEIVDIVKLLIEKNYDIPQKLLSHIEDLNSYYSSSDIYYQVVKSLVLDRKIPFNKIQPVLMDSIGYVDMIEILSYLLLERRSKEITHKGWELLNIKGKINKSIKLNVIKPEDVPSDIEINLNESFSFKKHFNRQIL